MRFGSLGGFITSVAESVEFVLTPAIMVFFIGTYLTEIFETRQNFQLAWWLIGYIVFVGVNVRGAELSLNVTVRDLRVKIP